jgi:hypothetical protein
MEALWLWCCLFWDVLWDMVPSLAAMVSVYADINRDYTVKINYLICGISELYLSSDRHLSAKLVSIFADRG